MNERQIFEAALDIADLARRKAFLSQACGADAALRARVDALLTSHAAASQFLETPAVQQINAPLDSSGEDTMQLPPSNAPAAGDDDSEDGMNPSGPDISFLSPSTRPNSIGTLGHYEILNVLGQGAFGIVFRAFDEKLHRHVAIKTMSVQMAATSPPRKRFLREARAAAAIRHENVVQVYSVEEQPLPYLVMEFIDGETLQQKQRNHGPLEVPELLHIGRQISAGLAAAHAQTLIHRDVKPGNILLEKGAEQKVKITDFGLARAADDASLTRSGMISGTPLYMAPEQALGQTLDQRSDLFSLGSVLYELATGRPPFRAPNTVAVLRRVVDDTPRPIQEIIPETPDWIVAIINKLLAKNPDERYQTAKEVADLLARCQSELQLTGQVTCVPGAGSVSARSTPNETIIFPTAAKDSKGSRPPLASGKLSTKTVVGVLALLALIPALWYALNPGTNRSPVSPAASRTVSAPRVPRSAPARTGPALSFTNTEDRVDVVAVPMDLSQPWTFEAWAEITDQRNVISQSVATLGPVRLKQYYDKAWEVELSQFIDGGPYTRGAALRDGVFIPGRVHLASQWTGQQLQLFVNGQPVTTAPHVFRTETAPAEIIRELLKPTQTVPLQIGNYTAERRWPNAGNSLGGTVDALRISRGNLYSGQFSPGPLMKTADTIALYDFAHGSGEVLKDITGNGHDGKIVGASWVQASRAASAPGVPADPTNSGGSRPPLAPRRYDSGEWIDVLSLIDPPADKFDVPGMTGKNLWRKESDDLVVARDEKSSKLLLPLDSAWSAFECELEFTRRAGRSGLNVNIPTKLGECPVVVDHPSGPGGVFLGARDKGVILTEGTQLETGKRTTLRIEVRREQNVDRVSVTLNGKNVGEWSGDRNQIGRESDEGFPVGRRMSVWLPESGNEFAIHRIRVRMLDGETATTVRPVPVVLPTDGQTPLAATGWHGWPVEAPAPAIAPFNAAQAKKHQEEWAAYLKVPVEYTNSIGMKFRLIPPGEFMMGSTLEEIEAGVQLSGNALDYIEAARSEGPQRKVVITKPFYMGTTEVTQLHYERIMSLNPSHFSPSGPGRQVVKGMDTADHPVDSVDWNNANRFCELLSSKDVLRPDLGSPKESTAQRYQLPTEAEWEFACRSGTETSYWCGNLGMSIDAVAWTSGNSEARTHRVAQKLSNPFGLFDVYGNAFEWIADSWTRSTDVAGKSNVDPFFRSTEVEDNVLRGGNCFETWAQCRSGRRFRMNKGLTNTFFGFRVALSVDAVRQQLKLTSPDPLAAGWPVEAPAPAIAPFNAAQGKKHQEEWAKYLGVPAEYTNSIGMKFRLIPPGEFLMGSTKEEIESVVAMIPESWGKVWHESVRGEHPQHRVVLTHAFYLGIHEVSQGQFEKVIGRNPSHFSPPGNGAKLIDGIDSSRLPVENVTWNDAVDFCKEISVHEKTEAPQLGYRLPTEAEWEYSCRAGTSTRYSDGNDTVNDQRVGWFWPAGDRTHSGGECAPNSFGLFDMHGNVWEWVNDIWQVDYYSHLSTSLVVDPIGPVESVPMRSMRGGTFALESHVGRSAHRSAAMSNSAVPDRGFRVALPVDAVRQALKVTGSTLPKPAVPPPSVSTRWYKSPQFEAWAREVAAMPIVKQVEAVSQKLVELNPSFDGNVTPDFGNDVVTGIAFRSDNVEDISPVRALGGLQSLRIAGAWRNTVFQDLSPLQGMSLKELGIEGTRVSDLSPLKEMKLEVFRCGYTQVSDLTPLKEMTLTTVNCWHTPVTDLSTLNPAKLTTLEFNGTGVPDLSVLKGFQLNSLSFTATQISDLTPLQGMPLEGLDCGLTPVKDLSPLNGMKLKYLNCGGTQISSLLPLKDSPLTSLICSDTQISDLSPLEGKKLTSLYCGNTQISDLSPLKGMELTGFFCAGTQVVDYSPLNGMPLGSIELDFQPDRDSELLRSMKQLQSINNKTSAEFWKDAAEQR